LEDKAKALVALLKAQNRTITTAESLTGGRIAAAITEVPGSSQVFPGGVVSYCDQVKHRILGVPAEALERYGAVSEPVAKAMADGAAKLMGTNLALSATGLAGPDGDGTHPVGTVFLGLWADGTLICQKRVFSGDRAAVQEQSVKTALDMALDYLKT
jgi:PncC family amidohydrolase